MRYISPDGSDVADSGVAILKPAFRPESYRITCSAVPQGIVVATQSGEQPTVVPYSDCGPDTVATGGAILRAAILQKPAIAIAYKGDITLHVLGVAARQTITDYRDTLAKQQVTLQERIGTLNTILGRNAPAST